LRVNVRKDDAVVVSVINFLVCIRLVAATALSVSSFESPAVATVIAAIGTDDSVNLAQAAVLQAVTAADHVV